MRPFTKNSSLKHRYFRLEDGYLCIVTDYEESGKVFEKGKGWKRFSSASRVGTFKFEKAPENLEDTGLELYDGNKVRIKENQILRNVKSVSKVALGIGVPSYLGFQIGGPIISVYSGLAGLLGTAFICKTEKDRIIDAINKYNKKQREK